MISELYVNFMPICKTLLFSQLSKDKQLIFIAISLLVASLAKEFVPLELPPFISGLRHRFLADIA